MELSLKISHMKKATNYTHIKCIYIILYIYIVVVYIVYTICICAYIKNLKITSELT